MPVANYFTVMKTVNRLFSWAMDLYKWSNRYAFIKKVFILIENHKTLFNFAETFASSWNTS